MDPCFNPSNSGRLRDSNTYHLGNKLMQGAVPAILGPVYRSTKSVGTPGTNSHVPGWLNALTTGGVVGALGGGLINKYKGGTFGRGASWGGLLGGLGMLGLGHVLSGPDWAKRVPLIGGLF